MRNVRNEAGSRTFQDHDNAKAAKSSTVVHYVLIQHSNGIVRDDCRNGKRERPFKEWMPKVGRMQDYRVPSPASRGRT